MEIKYLKEEDALRLNTFLDRAMESLPKHHFWTYLVTFGEKTIVTFYYRGVEVDQISTYEICDNVGTALDWFDAMVERKKGEENDRFQ